mgnify:CR=1 FL=1
MVDYLISVDYKTCKHKDLLLLLLTTGMRVGELTKLNISDMQITNINDILKIKSAFFINEYYKNECSKIVQKRPGSKIKFKEEFYSSDYIFYKEDTENEMVQCQKCDHHR